MDPTVAAALIAAISSLLVSAWTLQRQGRSATQLAELQHKLLSEARQEERQYEAREQLARYREPLLDASVGLEGRLSNILDGGFLSYLSSPDERRRRLALLGTLYRLGRYWTVVDSLYLSADTLAFHTDPATRDVDNLLEQIASTFADDQLGGHSLMVWRDEQRAVAELMRSGGVGGDAAVVGFATFVDNYPNRFEPWLGQVEQDLRRPEVHRNERLVRLQDLLRQLVGQLRQGRG